MLKKMMQGGLSIALMMPATSSYAMRKEDAKIIGYSTGMYVVAEILKKAFSFGHNKYKGKTDEESEPLLKKEFNDYKSKVKIEDYATKEDVKNMVKDNNSDTSDYIKKSELNDSLKNTLLTLTIPNPDLENDNLSIMFCTPTKKLIKTSLEKYVKIEDLNNYTKSSDLNGYAKKEDLPNTANFITNEGLNNKKYLTEESLHNTLDNYQKKGEYITKEDIKNFVTNDVITSFIKKNELNGYALKSETLNNNDLAEYAKKSDLPDTDNFITIEGLEGKKYLTQESLNNTLNNYIKKEEVDELVKNKLQELLKDYATKVELDTDYNLLDGRLKVLESEDIKEVKVNENN